MVRAELDALECEFPGFRSTLVIRRLGPNFGPGESAALATLLDSLTGRHPATVSFGTEAALLAAAGAEAVVFGPGDLATAHRTGEHVPAGELHDCVSILREAILQMCCAPGR
jgi:acetylornithine deacetylase